MELLRKFRWVLYPVLGFMFFFTGIYCSFPTDVLREMTENSVTQASMNLSRPGIVPTVSIGDISLWRLSGIKISSLKIIAPSQSEAPNQIYKIDSLRARMGIFGLLFGSKNLSVASELYKGSIDSSIKLNKQNKLNYIFTQAEKVNLGKMNFIEARLGIPMQGILNLAVELSAATDLQKDGKGSIKLSLDKGEVGPGALSIPMGAFVSSLNIPQVNLGKFDAYWVLEKGKFTSKKISLSGGDLQADVDLAITLGAQPMFSRLKGTGWFSLKPEFINSNETVKTLYELMPELRSALKGDGKVKFSLGGTLLSPRFALEG